MCAYSVAARCLTPRNVKLLHPAEANMLHVGCVFFLTNGQSRLDPWLAIGQQAFQPFAQEKGEIPNLLP